MTRTGNQVEVSWTSADPQPGDYYMWSRNEVFSQGPWETTTDPGVSFEVEEGSAVCIDVVLRRADGKASAVLPKCVQAG